MVQPSEPVPIDKFEHFDSSLNESQKDAVQFALEAAEVALIHGPPGVCNVVSPVALLYALTRGMNRQGKPTHLSRSSVNCSPGANVYSCAARATWLLVSRLLEIVPGPNTP